MLRKSSLHRVITVADQDDAALIIIVVHFIDDVADILMHFQVNLLQLSRRLLLLQHVLFKVACHFDLVPVGALIQVVIFTERLLIAGRRVGYLVGHFNPGQALVFVLLFSQRRHLRLDAILVIARRAIDVSTGPALELHPRTFTSPSSLMHPRLFNDLTAACKYVSLLLKVELFVECFLQIECFALELLYLNFVLQNFFIHFVCGFFVLSMMATWSML